MVSAPGLIFRDPSSSPALTTRGIRYGYMINCLLPVEFISVVCFIGLFKLSSVLNMSCLDDVLDKLKALDVIRKFSISSVNTNKGGKILLEEKNLYLKIC